MQSVTCLSKLRSGLYPRTLHVLFPVDEVTLGRVCLPVFTFSPVTIVLPVLHTHLHLHTTLILDGQTGEGWQTSKGNALSQIGEYRT